jgi:hypothetical protein
LRPSTVLTRSAKRDVPIRVKSVALHDEQFVNKPL